MLYLCEPINIDPGRQWLSRYNSVLRNGISDQLSGSDEDILGVEKHWDESPTRGMLSVVPEDITIKH
jgi:hypothetical protein